MDNKIKNPVLKADDTNKLPQKPKQHKIEVTLENAPKLTVHFLQQIYGRLGYMIKILEEIKNKK